MKPTKKSISIENYAFTFRNLIEWTKDEKSTFVAENENGEEFNLLRPDTVIHNAKKCSLVIEGVKYDLPFPEEEQVSVSARLIEGNGLAVMLNQNPLMYLAGRHSELNRFPENAGAIILFKPEHFSGLERFQNLRYIAIHAYEGEELADLTVPDSAEQIEFNRCEALKNLKPLRRLKNLAHLVVMTNKGLRTTGDIRYMQGLRSIKFLFCESLSRFSGLDTLSALREIVLFGCGKLKTIEIPLFGSSPEYLSIGGCVKLKSLVVYNASRLETLDISLCTALERVSLYNPIALRHLKANIVWQLKRIEGLESATELKNIETDNDGIRRQVQEKHPAERADLVNPEGLSVMRKLIMDAWDKAMEEIKKPIK